MAIAPPVQPQTQPQAPYTPPDPNDPTGQNIQRGASEVAIDHVNQWMRTTPWYREQVASWGQNPDRPTGLNDAQKTAIMRAAQAHGVVIDEGNIEVDQGGNFNPKGHKLRNTMIVVGIAAATIATMGAAGAFAGAAGAASGAGAGGAGAAGLAGVEGAGFGLTAGGAAGLGAATTVPALGGAAGGGILGGAASVAGGTGAAGAAAAPLSVAGVEGGAAGLSSAALPTGLGAATAVPAAGAATGAAATTPLAADAFIGPTQAAQTGINSGSILSNAQRAGNIGRVLNGVNAGQQQGREAEAQATTAWDRNANQRYANSIDAAALNLKAPDARMSSSVKGDILANAKPFQWTGETKMSGNTPLPQFTGGLSTDIYSDNTKALGSLMSQQALQQQQANGGQAVGPQDPLTPLPKVGPGGKILSTAGTIASLYGAYMGGR